MYGKIREWGYQDIWRKWEKFSTHFQISQLTHLCTIYMCLLLLNTSFSLALRSILSQLVLKLRNIAWCDNVLKQANNILEPSEHNIKIIIPFKNMPNMVTLLLKSKVCAKQSRLHLINDYLFPYLGRGPRKLQGVPMKSFLVLLDLFGTSAGWC